MTSKSSQRLSPHPKLSLFFSLSGFGSFESSVKIFFLYQIEIDSTHVVVRDGRGEERGGKTWQSEDNLGCQFSTLRQGSFFVTIQAMLAGHRASSVFSSHFSVGTRRLSIHAMTGL